MKILKQWIHSIAIRWCCYVDRHISYCHHTVQGLNDIWRHVIIGRHTYGVTSQSILFAHSSNPPTVTIGNFCSIAPGALILANVDHPLNFPSTYPFKTLLFCSESSHKELGYDNHDAVSRGDIYIGHDVWIGQNAIVLSGVCIGTGAVIGAGSVVTKDIPPYAIAVGNPAKVVRYRFSPEIIKRLLISEWWLLPDEKLRRLETYLYDTDIEAFLNRVQAE